MNQNRVSYLRIACDGQVCICPPDEGAEVMRQLEACGRRHTWKAINFTAENFAALPDFEGWQ